MSPRGADPLEPSLGLLDGTGATGPTGPSFYTQASKVAAGRVGAASSTSQRDQAWARRMTRSQSCAALNAAFRRVALCLSSSATHT